MKNWLKKLGPLIGLVFVFGLFSILKPETFPRPANIEIMLLQTAVVGTAALGMTIVIIGGGIDLSVGSQIALCTVTVAMLLGSGAPIVISGLAGLACGLLLKMVVVRLLGRFCRRIAADLIGIAVGGAVCALTVHTMLSKGTIGTMVAGAFGNGLPPLAAIVGGVLAGAACGGFIGTLVTRLRLAPFIVTLGMWGALRGAAKGLADEQTVVAPGTWLNRLLNVLSDDRKWMLVPPGVWLLLLLALLVAGFLRYTKLGRQVFAIGSNEQTARLCGVPVENTKVAVYVMGSVFAALAGILQFSYLTLGDPTTANGMELDVIAAVVIGGGSLAGGEGSVLGSLVGALIMTAVANGCTKMQYPNWVQEIVTGGIIVVAVTLDRLRRRQKE